MSQENFSAGKRCTSSNGWVRTPGALQKGSGDFGIDFITIWEREQSARSLAFGDWCQFLVGTRGRHLQCSKHANQRDASAFTAEATAGHASQSRWRPVTPSEKLEPPAAATNETNDE